MEKAAKVILSEDVFKTFIQSTTVPDWVLLYFKISARLPDGAWQMLLNLTRLGDTGKNEDSSLLLSKNKIKAIRKVVFTCFHSCQKDVWRETSIRPIDWQPGGSCFGYCLGDPRTKTP